MTSFISFAGYAFYGYRNYVIVSRRILALHEDNTEPHVLSCSLWEDKQDSSTSGFCETSLRHSRIAYEYKKALMALLDKKG